MEETIGKVAEVWEENKERKREDVGRRGRLRGKR